MHTKRASGAIQYSMHGKHLEQHKMHARNNDVTWIEQQCRIENGPEYWMNDRHADVPPVGSL